MSTPAQDKGPSLRETAEQIAQSIQDLFSGLFDYEGHSNRSASSVPGERVAAVQQEYDEAQKLVTEANGVQQPLLFGIRQLITRRDKNLEQRNQLNDEHEQVAYLLDDDEIPGKGEPLPGRVRALLTQLGAAEKERDQWKAEHANATRLLNEQSEAIRKAQPKPVGLSEQLQRMDKVITDMIAAVGAGSTLAKAADIRRLQARDYDLGHDVTHGWSLLAQAATALQMRQWQDWPWASPEQWNKLANLPLHERLAHAAALLCAAGDVAKAEGL